MANREPLQNNQTGELFHLANTAKHLPAFVIYCASGGFAFKTIS